MVSFAFARLLGFSVFVAFSIYSQCVFSKFPAIFAVFLLLSVLPDLASILASCVLWSLLMGLRFVHRSAVNCLFFKLGFCAFLGAAHFASLSVFFFGSACVVLLLSEFVSKVFCVFVVFCVWSLFAF